MRKINDDKIIHPPIKSHGIKTKIIPEIKALVDSVKDENSVFVEPFLGTGVVSLNIGMEKTIASDVNIHIINLYKRIQAGVVSSKSVREYLEFEGELLKENGYEHYLKIRERFNQYHNSLDFIFISRACFNGLMRFNRKGGFNTPFCKNNLKFNERHIETICSQIDNASRIVKNTWEFHSCSFEDILSRCTVGNEIIYCDPPYMGRDTNFFESWNEEKESKLSESLRATNSKFILSTWHHEDSRENEMVGKYWGGLNIKLVDHFYHVGATVERRNKIVEALIFNF